MSTVNIGTAQGRNDDPTGGATLGRDVPTDGYTTNWHATFPALAAVNASSGFTDPPTTEMDRIPALTLAAGGTPGTYTIVGQYDGEEVTQTILTVASDTVVGTDPLDSMTSITGPDPGANLNLVYGDAVCNPVCRGIHTGPSGGQINFQLERESDARLRTLPIGADLARRIKRINFDAVIPAAGMEVLW